jgi:hypothetical protein
MRVPQYISSADYNFLCKSLMRKLLKTVILSLLVSLLAGKTSYCTEYTENQEKNILLIFSQIPNTPAYSYMLEGIREK